MKWGLGSIVAFAALWGGADAAFADSPSSPKPPPADPPPAAVDGESDDSPSPALVNDDGAAPPADPLGPDAVIDRWCAPELDALSNDVCTFTPTREMGGPRTLVIFLHGVVKPDTKWQWAQQRGAARAAEAHGFSVIMPHGRVGIGPKGMEQWWTWPTASAAQATVEAEVVAEWAAAQSELEARTHHPFERVWVFGFSNGAYYATSLAMRGRLSSADTAPKADGFAVFAGGSGASYLEKAAKATKTRAPVFVAWGDKDPAHGDQVKLAKMLRGAGWPSKSEGAKRAGHVMTDKQVADAVRFLAQTKTKIELPDASPKKGTREPTKVASKQVAKPKGPKK